MEFEVTFTCDEHENYTICHGQVCDIGIGIVDEIRQEFNIHNFPIEKIKNETRYVDYKFIKITISEYVARTSGHFQKTNAIKVFVPKGFLTQYLTIKFIIEKNSPLPIIPSIFQMVFFKTPKIQNITIINDIQRDAIINDWQEAGFPLHWPEKL